MLFPNAETRISYIFNCFFLSYKIEDENLKSQIIADFKANKRIFVPNEGFIFETENINEILKYTKNFKINAIDCKIFSNNKIKISFQLINDTINFEFDIFSNIFFYLSGYQEVIIKKRDALDRFIYADSCQKLLENVHLPIVNILFEQIAVAINQTYKINVLNKYANPHVWISHDIDIWANIKRNCIIQTMKKGNIFAAIHCLLFQNNQKWIFEISKFEKKFNFSSTFFFMSEKRKFMTYHNADYDISKKKYTKILSTIIDNKKGIHPSFGANTSDEIMKKNSNKFNFKVNKNRFHFLMFDVLKTPNLLQKNEIKIDSTLAFSDNIGCRNGTTLPFYLFDFQSNSCTTVVEIPLIIMDATLFYPHYLNVQNKDDFIVKIQVIITQLQSIGGILTINFHNHIFVEPKYKLWKECFELLLLKLQKKNFIFINKDIQSYLDL